MPTTITPNMSLILPTPGQEPGPQYGADQNQSYTIIDSHNHGPGSGVPVTPTGLNINANLPFNNFSATKVYGVQFSAPASNALLTFLYTNAQSGGGINDLFYNDGAGNVIALTKAGAVNATIASIPGESYAGGTFTWVQGNGSTVPANFDIGSVIIRPNTAGTTNGVVLGPPSAISSLYNVQLPIVPGATSIMQINSSGDMIGTLVPDNSTITIASQVLKVPAQGITATQIANNTITNDQIAPVGRAISLSSGAFSDGSGVQVTIPNMGVSITTRGEDVDVFFLPDSTSSPAYVGAISTAVATPSVTWFLYVDGSNFYEMQQSYTGTSSGDTIRMPPGILNTTVTGLAAGTHTFQLQALNGFGSVVVNHVVMYARAQLIG